MLVVVVKVVFHGAVHVGVGNLDLELLRLLQDQLFVHQLVERRERRRAKRRAVVGYRHARLGLGDQPLAQVRLRDDDVTDDGDDAVERDDTGARDDGASGRGRASAVGGGAVGCWATSAAGARAISAETGSRSRISSKYPRPGHEGPGRS